MTFDRDTLMRMAAFGQANTNDFKHHGWTPDFLAHPVEFPKVWICQAK